MIAEDAIWVCGEALIDLLPNSYGEFKPIVGGGPANTAKALAHLGQKCYFIGGLSIDSYGSLIESELREYEVDLSLTTRSNAPTAIAKVELDSNGRARYEFALEGSATFDFRKNWLPSGRPAAIYIGGLATILEPGATELFKWAAGLEREIIFDPNVRPTVLGDRSRYRAAFESWAGISTIVKLSIDDLEFLYGVEVVDEGLRAELLDLGPELFVITHGADGISAFDRNGKVEVPAGEIELVDTVGAGDVVGAVVAEGLMLYGKRELAGNQLKAVLERAAKAAAINCSRAGAKPPRASELV